MGTGLSYLDECCTTRKKKGSEENAEKVEVLQPINVVQAAAGEEKQTFEPQARPSPDEVPSAVSVKDVKEKEEKNSKLSKLSKSTNDIAVEDFELISGHLSTKGDFIIKVLVEFVEITYKLCDDFGSYFKPYLEIIFDSQKKTLIQPDDKNDKLNTSNISENIQNSEMNNSLNMVNVSGMERLKSQGQGNSSKEKFYHFKLEEILNGNPSNSYSSINFYVKNTIVNSNITNAHPPIIIGESHIPVNLISETKNGTFDGFLRFRLRNTQEIGKIKVRISITDKNSVTQNIFKNTEDLDASMNMDVY